MAAASNAARRRKQRKAPLSGTETFLRYLELYLKDRPNRKLAVAALLRCSISTATALTNRRKPYAHRVKRAWADLLCAAVGKPIGRIIPADPGGLSEVLVGWVHTPAGKAALQYAADMALGVMLRASDFSLFGHFTLHQEGLLPYKVEVLLSPLPHMAVPGKGYDMHRIVFSIGASRSGMQMVYQRPDGVVATCMEATRNGIDNILSEIYARTKSFTKNLTARKN